MALDTVREQFARFMQSIHDELRPGLSDTAPTSLVSSTSTDERGRLLRAMEAAASARRDTTVVAASDAVDELELWRAAAEDVYYYQNAFGSQSWRSLHALGKLQTQWPIDAACRVEVHCGVRTVSTMVSLLRELALEPEGRAILLELHLANDVHLQRWADRALAALSPGASAPDA